MAESIPESRIDDAGPEAAEDAGKAGRQPRIIRLGPQGGTYELVRPLAQGGMAEVFLARRVGSSGFRAEVAIKRLRRELLAGAEVRAMFLHEAKLAAHLSHPNIARVFDLQEVGIHHFLVMEYVHGATLRGLITQSERAGKPLSAGLVCTVGAAVAEALHYANTSCDENGKPLRIVHRDISPHNIVIGSSGEVKLIDFGIAWSQLEGRNETQGVKLKGKFAYMSPEQVGAEPLDGRSDIFSLAVVLVEMLTGRRIFETKSESQTLLRVLEAAPAVVRKATLDIPAGLRDILVRCLARERDARYPDGAALATALRSHLIGQQQLFGLLETAAEVAALGSAAERLPRDGEAGPGTPEPSQGSTPSKKRASKPGLATPAAAPAVKPRGSDPSIPPPPPANDTGIREALAESVAAIEAERAAPDLAERAALDMSALDAAHAAAVDEKEASAKTVVGAMRARSRSWKAAAGAGLALIAAVVATRLVDANRARSVSLASQASLQAAAAPASEAGPAPIAAEPPKSASAMAPQEPATASSVAAAGASAQPARLAAPFAAATPVATPAPASEKRIAAPGSLQIRVFAGAPVKGAHVRAVALLRDGTIDSSVGDAGTLGSCAATSADGRCELHLAAAALAGPLKLIASGAGARWTDPLDGVTQLYLPAGAELTSTLAAMPAQGQRVPITLWTSLADAAAARTNSAAGRGDLRASLEETDAIFGKHLGGEGDFSLRSALPEALDVGSSSLTAGLRTALADAALGQWAHELGQSSGAGRAFNAAALAMLLARDISADGRFDGLGASGEALSTPGRKPASLSGAPLKSTLAHALDTFVAEAQPPALRGAAQRMSLAIRDDQSPLF